MKYLRESNPSKSHSARRSSKTSLSLLDSDIVQVPTFPEKPQQSIEIAELTSSEIASLKESDPFMYYSIPAARNAAMRGKDLPPSCVDGPSSHSSNVEGCSRKARKVSCKIIKQRRLSVEMHPDALLQEMLRDTGLTSTMPPPSDQNCLDFDNSLLSLYEEIEK